MQYDFLAVWKTILHEPDPNVYYLNIFCQTWISTTHTYVVPTLHVLKSILHKNVRSVPRTLKGTCSPDFWLQDGVPNMSLISIFKHDKALK